MHTESPPALEVIGAGFGRTGTLSLKRALEELGFGPCHHWVEINRRPGLARRWLRALRAHAREEPVSWDALYAGYRSTTDWPGCSLTLELLAHAPTARVILTTREPASWYESVSATLLPLYEALPWWSWLVPRIGAIRALSEQAIWGPQGTFGDRFRDRDHALAVLAAHEEAIRSAVPPEQLLEYDITQGWEPLCRFLECPVPETPFPRTHERAQIRRWTGILRILTRVLPILALATALLLLVAGVLGLQRLG